MTRRTLLSAVVVSVLALTPFQAPLAAQAAEIPVEIEIGRARHTAVARVSVVRR